MKKMWLVSFVLIANNTLWSDENNSEQPFLQKVEELNNQYKPYTRQTYPGIYNHAITYPPKIGKPILTKSIALYGNNFIRNIF